MIILHNSRDKDSRNFLTTIIGRAVDTGEFVNGVLVIDEHTIYDWYKGGREAWWEVGGTKSVSAFPSVVLSIPEHDVSERTSIDGEVEPAHKREAEQIAVRKPSSRAGVNRFIDAINVDLSEAGVVPLRRE
jgi:hypothetical protein